MPLYKCLDLWCGIRFFKGRYSNTKFCPSCECPATLATEEEIKNYEIKKHQEREDYLNQKRD
jgi:hypothetical protein